MNSVSLKRTDTGWELNYSSVDTKTEQYPTLDEAIAKLKELEAAQATPASAV